MVFWRESKPSGKGHVGFHVGEDKDAYRILVIASFLFIYLITNDYNTITNQALILIGIGTSTALGGAMIDASKRNTANEELGVLLPERARLQAELDELDRRRQDSEAKITAAGAAAADADKAALGELKISLSQKQESLTVTEKKIKWRRGRDSNPRWPFDHSGFRDRSPSAYLIRGKH